MHFGGRDRKSKILAEQCFAGQFYWNALHCYDYVTQVI